MKYNIYALLMIFATSCAQKSLEEAKITKAFKDYWYNGKAEITSFDLEQVRYGEIRKGHAVNIFVTEPFSKKHNTKADEWSQENISVLKLNATKKFNTGIYDYAVMTSTFLPVKTPQASLKISSSTQEWCGHEYIELKNKDDEFELNNFSYFQGASFKDKTLPKRVVLEDDIWSKIRLTPYDLPQGNFNALPSFVYLRFSHNKVKSYLAEAKTTKGTATSTYKIRYPNLNRTLNITFENDFPYKILGWTETYFSGYGTQRKLMTTKATLKKTMHIAYWQTNANKDLYLRKLLGIE